MVRLGPGEVDRQPRDISSDKDHGNLADTRVKMTRPPRLGSHAARIELGLMAFSPAMALLAFRARENAVWRVVFGLPAVAGLSIAVVVGVVVRRGNPEPFAFSSIEDASDEALGHVSS